MGNAKRWGASLDSRLRGNDEEGAGMHVLAEAGNDLVAGRFPPPAFCGIT